ncbi:MAG: hypothetical protein JXA18_07755 [Chitinispirillaceae bacterium]|nr:hypothetical protein [Chitinispirillaceae bacterium]
MPGRFDKLTVQMSADPDQRDEAARGEHAREGLQEKPAMRGRQSAFFKKEKSPCAITCNDRFISVPHSPGLLLQPVSPQSGYRKTVRSAGFITLKERQRQQGAEGPS